MTEAGQGHCTGVVEVAEYPGSDTFLYVSCENLGTLTVRTKGSAPDHKGETVGLTFEERHTHFFDS